jgi:hypothetical protein
MNRSNVVEYVATDESREKIPYVRVTTPCMTARAPFPRLTSSTRSSRWRGAAVPRSPRFPWATRSRKRSAPIAGRSSGRRWRRQRGTRPDPRRRPRGTAPSARRGTRPGPERRHVGINSDIRNEESKASRLAPEDSTIVAFCAPRAEHCAVAHSIPRLGLAEPRATRAFVLFSFRPAHNS